MDEQLLKNFHQTSLWKQEQHPYLIEELLSNKGLQSTHTPLNLCAEIIGKLGEYTNLANAQIAVLFNLEFVDTLIRVYRVNPANIVFFADSELEAEAARVWYKVACSDEPIAWDAASKKIIMPNIKKKFDVVVMNPPYQNADDKRNPLWKQFADLSLKMISDGGYVCAVHPCSWRKVEAKQFEQFVQNNMLYLSIHNQKDGMKTFKAGTRYDWYVLQKAGYNGKTIVQDETGKVQTIDIRSFPYLPHGCLEIFQRIFAKGNEKKCEVLYSCDHHTQRPYMKEKESEIFCNPCIHATSKTGPRCWYSSKKGGFIGAKKVIFGSASPQNAFFDSEGKYGTTQHCFSIPVSSDKDGSDLVSFAKTKEFEQIINMTKFSGFETDHELFRHFRKDFWKDFI